jgi:hypothetical protein
MEIPDSNVNKKGELYMNFDLKRTVAVGFYVATLTLAGCHSATHHLRQTPRGNETWGGPVQGTTLSGNGIGGAPTAGTLAGDGVWSGPAPATLSANGLSSSSTPSDSGRNYGSPWSGITPPASGGKNANPWSGMTPPNSGGKNGNPWSGATPATKVTVARPAIVAEPPH